MNNMREASLSATQKLMILPCLALAAGGYLFGVSLGEDQLAAAPLGSADLDGDGLVDTQESILLTDAFIADSDHDGFGDLEEFARGSDPNLFASTPLIVEGAAAMTGRVEAGTFRAVTALFVPGGDITGASISFGAMVGGQLITLDPLLFFTGASLSVVPVGTGNDLVYLLDTPIPESLVIGLGDSALFATYAPAGATKIEAASTLNLTSIGGVVVQVVGGIGPTATVDSLYRPLTEPGGLPATWTPGQVCVQNLTTIGVIGSVLQQVVDSAQCEPLSSDSYCAPDCSNLTGTIQEIIDPVGLIGG